MKKTIFVFIASLLLSTNAMAEYDPFLGQWQLLEDDSVQANIIYHSGTYWLNAKEEDRQAVTKLLFREGCLHHAEDEGRQMNAFTICPGKDQNSLTLVTGEKLGTLVRVREY